MNTTGHYACSSRPRTVQEESQLAAAAAALFSSAARRLNDLEVGYVGDVLASRAIGDYDTLAGLDTGDETMDDLKLETNAIVEHVRVAGGAKTDRPRPEWIRGKCPKCGDDLVSNCYYVGGRGYQIAWECWSSLSETPTCDYRKVL